MDTRILDPAFVADIKRRLDHDQLISRREVHKLANAEVFVTGTAPVSDDMMMLAGELPRTHCYYGDGAGFPARFDLMSILELCRQACFVMAHRHYGIPVGPQFILRSLEAELDPAVAFQRQFDPLRVFVQCSAKHRFERDSELVGVAWEFDIEAESGIHVATAAAAMSWMPRQRWARLRGIMREESNLHPDEISYRRPEPSAVDPATVGRESASNVVLTKLDADGSNVRAELVVDILHHGLFDHYVDHLSGMLEAEACRQLALASASAARGGLGDAVVRALGLTFSAVGELDVPTHCQGTLDSPQSADECGVAVRLVQRDNCLCDSWARVAFAPSAESVAATAPDSRGGLG